jgi:hypothetical protein
MECGSPAAAFEQRRTAFPLLALKFVIPTTKSEKIVIPSEARDPLFPSSPLLLAVS